MGGTKKLSGSELIMTLAPFLQVKMPNVLNDSLVARLPAVHRRAMLVQPLISGRRVLWVDDQPSNNFYERVALAQFGLSVDIAESSEQGMGAPPGK